MCYILLSRNRFSGKPQISKSPANFYAFEGKSEADILVVCVNDGGTRPITEEERSRLRALDSKNVNQLEVVFGNCPRCSKAS